MQSGVLIVYYAIESMYSISVCLLLDVISSMHTLSREKSCCNDPLTVHVPLCVPDSCSEPYLTPTS